MIQFTILFWIRTIFNNWRTSLFLGFLFILMGILVLGASFGNFEMATRLFAILILFSGIWEIIYAFMNRKLIKGWKWFLTGGLLELAIGLILISNQAVTIFTLSNYLAFWMLYRSSMSIGVAFEQQSPNIVGWEWLFIFVIGSLAFALSILNNHIFDHFNTLNSIALTCIVFGIFKAILALGLKHLNRNIIIKSYNLPPFNTH